MPPEDLIRLRHMLDAAREALKSAHGRDRPDLESDRIWMLGLVKCIEIIGEAAAHVSEPTRLQHPGIPWSQIIAMRNRLVHVYFDVDLNLVWDTLTIDLPELITQLENIPEIRP